jgi:succinate dehydrogenase/fumarate reductase flavoprotein subunit
MMTPARLDTDVLVIGAGGAGMYAAIEAARSGAARVLLLDRSLIGRGGATVMAQMTVAAAMGEGDAPEFHLRDTLAAGRGLCDVALSRLLCEAGAECISEMDRWRVGWARGGDGRLAQVQAPGHDRARCVYVDFLATGPAVSKTLRAQVQRVPSIRRVGELAVTDLLTRDGEVVGAAALDVARGGPVVVSAAATILATGGLTRLYARNSASANMSGDGFALALRAGRNCATWSSCSSFPSATLPLD